MAATIRLIYTAIRNSYGKGTASPTLRNTSRAITYESCNNIAVFGKVRHFYVCTRWIFDDLQYS